MPLENRYVAAVRQRVMKHQLVPRGFMERGTTYVLADGDHIWAVDFQGGQHGGKFFVNIAFHFRFAPSCFHLRRIPPEEYTLLDCCLRSRLHLEADHYEAAYKYPATREECDALFQRLAGEIWAELEIYRELFRGPRYFVELLTPEMLILCRAWLCGEVEEDAEFTGDVDALLLAMNWFPDDYARFLFLAHCAREIGSNDAAKEYARLGIAEYDDYHPTRAQSTPYKKVVPIGRVNGRVVADEVCVIQSRERILAALECLRV